MRNYLFGAVTAIGLAGLASCSAPAPQHPPALAAASVAAPATVVKGQSCIPISRIREARVVDDSTIDFYLSSREVLRSKLPNSCPQLGFERAFSYATSLSQLCSTDIITVIIQGGGPHRGASCGLGEFVPYTPVPTK